MLALSLGPLVAGTKYRGEFESRVKKILDEVKRAGRDIILFIDELHTLVGAGAAEGSLDLSSMIKPELARGELQCIGATTFDEYRKYVESDAALERRFQPVQVDEPTIEQTVAILKGLRPKYAAHHGVQIGDDAIEAAAALAARYIADRYLPDKAIDVVDEAAAGAAMHGETRVDVERVAAVVSRWTGIPQGTITDAQRAGLLALEEQLTTRVVGQDPAVRAVSEAIRRARAGLKDPRKPVGGFLFVGPSGVGKTELARALAHALFGTDDALVRLDLSEYTEAHTISRMLGAPPGYQGHDEPGQLTEPIRRRPYSVVLFDEIEKAHPDVAAILLQILDDGRVTDAKGRTIDFRHAIVVLTSNLDRDELEATLRAELIDRIDEIVVFKELGPREIEQIVTLQVALLAERLGAHAMQLDLSEPCPLVSRQGELRAGKRRALRRARDRPSRHHAALRSDPTRTHRRRPHRARRLRRPRHHRRGSRMTHLTRISTTARAALAALVLAGATGSAALAQTVPAGTPPAPGRPTANLVLDAMLASARAASINPTAAQSASLNSAAAIARYNMGDINGARSAAIQALIEANRLPQSQTNIPVLQSTIPQTSYLQTRPFPIAGGSIAALDANAFVAQARGAVAACTARNSPNTAPATQHLNSAEADAKAGRYQNVQTEARAAVDLCASAQQQLNNQPR